MRLYPLPPAEPASTTRTYPSSLSDAEWAVLQPLVQRPATPEGGRPPKHPLRVIIDAIRYLVRTGCAWRLLPRDLPRRARGTGGLPSGPPTAPWSASMMGCASGSCGGRSPSSAVGAVVDSQSVRAADTVPRASRGWDAGKKVNGRKRHLAVDTMGLLLVVLVTSACVQDRDAGRALLWLRRQAGRVGGVRAAPGGGDRTEAPWPVDL
jgi:hypothetical protein